MSLVDKIREITASKPEIADAMKKQIRDIQELEATLKQSGLDLETRFEIPLAHRTASFFKAPKVLEL